MASFNTESFPDSLAIVKEENMAIGSIDDVQVRTASLLCSLGNAPLLRPSKPLAVSCRSFTSKPCRCKSSQGESLTKKAVAHLQSLLLRLPPA